MLHSNQDVFSKHKTKIEWCNFVEHEIELKEPTVQHREGARRLTPHKLDACRKEIKTLLEYDMIEPINSPWACGVIMAKKKGYQLRFCCDFRYLNSVTVKNAYSIPRIDESLSKLEDAKFFIQFLIWDRLFGGHHLGSEIGRNGIAWSISVKKDAVWPMQRDRHFPDDKRFIE